jgi:hypothetical protein
MAADLFVVPTVTFRLLFVLIILVRPSTNRSRGGHRTSDGGLDRTAAAQCLFGERGSAISAPRLRFSLCRLASTIAAMNTQAVRTAPRSPWQNASAERVVGSIRRACLDHIIAINETGLRRVLTRYIAYYMESRTHLALDREGRAGHTTSPPASAGQIVVTPQVGGLHHRYDRVAA